MIGTTLLDIRGRIESLASGDGEFYLRCARTGDRPVPTSGLRFPDRGRAREAATATEQYRAALRRYDPAVPTYDVIVCQERRPGDAGTGANETRGQTRPSGTDVGRVEFCHRAAAAVFETLSSRGYDAVESAVMDAYLSVAERLRSPDGLCLCLVESMATELQARLDPGEQAAVLSAAAARLDVDSGEPAAAGPAAVGSALSRLRTVGLLGGYVYPVRGKGGRRGTALLAGYALSPRDGRLPLLPVLLELHRSGRGWVPVSVSESEPEGGWRLELAAGRQKEMAYSIAPEVPRR